MVLKVVRPVGRRDPLASVPLRSVSTPFPTSAKTVRKRRVGVDRKRETAVNKVLLSLVVEDREAMFGLRAAALMTVAAVRPIRVRDGG